MSDEAKKEGQKAPDETKAAELSDEDLGQVAGGMSIGGGIPGRGIPGQGLPDPGPGSASEGLPGSHPLNVNKITSW